MYIGIYDMYKMTQGYRNHEQLSYRLIVQILYTLMTKTTEVVIRGVTKLRTHISYKY